MVTVSVRQDGQVVLPAEIRSAYHLTDGTVLEITPVAADRFEMRVVASRSPLLDMLDEFADEGEAPDLAAEREALGDALDAAFTSGGRRPGVAQMNWGFSIQTFLCMRFIPTIRITLVAGR